jgi:hypothetical protein
MAYRYGQRFLLHDALLSSAFLEDARPERGPGPGGTQAAKGLPIGVRGDQDTNSIKRCNTFLADVPSTIDNGQNHDN